MVELTNQTKNDILLEPEPGKIKHLGPNLPNRDPENDGDAPPVIEISNADYEALKDTAHFKTLTETDAPGDMPDVQVREGV